MGSNNQIINSCVHDSAVLYNNVRLVRATVEAKCSIGDHSDIVDCRLDECSEVGRRNILRDVHLGYGSYTGTDTIIWRAEIGRFTSISWNVNVCRNSEHDHRRVSNYSDYWLKRSLGADIGAIEKPNDGTAVIGSDVLIGAGSNIIGPVHIGDGAVIGAGTVVTRDVPPYSIVCGTPGRVTGMRFEQSIIDELLRISWWDWPLDILKKHAKILLQQMNAETLAQLTEIYDREVMTCRTE